MQCFKKIIKQSLTLLFCSAILVNAQSVFAENTAENHAQHRFDWSGVYNGFIPCKDCQGIKTTLALNANNSYILISQYIGKSEREIVEKGKFDWNTENNTLVLTPRKELPTRHYLVAEGNNELFQLDDNGNRITGSDANRYVLHKTKMTPTSQSSHSGH